MFSGPMEDRLAIRELNDMYLDAVLRFDPKDWGATWAEDAHWDLMGHAVDGRDAIVAMWQGAMGGLEAVCMMCTPVSIEVDGDKAVSRAVTQEFLKPKDGPTRAVGGAYDDELAKIDGKWVFTKRSFRIVAEYGAEGA
jgi:uncharacterized protein (TIGR02246 family)